MSIQRLSKRFGEIEAVSDVSLSIAAGELFFLLGPSGCGKTTLLRCVAGFHEPEQGRIFIGDEDVTHVPPHRRNTGMVFQSYALWPHMNVARNVSFGLEMRSVPRQQARERVRRALERVRLDHRADARPNQLSGGQQQRVALARALVVEPRCLLLDEPLSNLDAQLRLDMRGEIRDICKQAGLTAIYVTHDQKEALSIADRLAVMREGRIEQVGTPMDIYRRPANRFVAGFIGDANMLEARVLRVEGGRTLIETPIGNLLASTPEPVPQADARAMLCLRPEAVRLGSPPADTPNRLEGVLRNTVYQGDTAHHRLSICATSERGGATIGVFELNPSATAREETLAVRAWIDPEDIRLLM